MRAHPQATVNFLQRIRFTIQYLLWVMWLAPLFWRKLSWSFSIFSLRFTLTGHEVFIQHGISAPSWTLDIRMSHLAVSPPPQRCHLGIVGGSHMVSPAPASWLRRAYGFSVHALEHCSKRGTDVMLRRLWSQRSSAPHHVVRTMDPAPEPKRPAQRTIETGPPEA